MKPIDCPSLIKKGICLGHCCGCVPISREIYEASKHLIQKKIKELANFSSEEIWPITFDAQCAFLKEDYSCAIYEKRPPCCRDYGYIEKLQCPYFDMKGNLRSPAKQRRMERIINHNVDFSMQALKKRINPK